MLGIKNGREPCAGPPCTRRGADGDGSPSRCPPALSSGPSQHSPALNRARNSASHPQTAAMAAARSEDEPSAAGSQHGSAKQTGPWWDGAADALPRGGHRCLCGPCRGSGGLPGPPPGDAAALNRALLGGDFPARRPNEVEWVWWDPAKLPPFPCPKRILRAL